ncbi:MAG: hypothetical protein LUQ07_00300 [Methanospirillum sp.]|nr:hypothetical protein [Methanospirillum sp.]
MVTFQTGQKTFEKYIDCKFYLEDLFGKRVDLMIKDSIKARFIPFIISEIVCASD